MTTFWDSHDPLRKGTMLLDKFKKLVAYCDANGKSEDIKAIAAHYLAFLLDDASFHPTSGSEMKWNELTQRQRDDLVDQLVFEWHQDYPNDLEDEYVPYSYLEAAAFSAIMDTVTRVRPAKKPRFVQHVARGPEEETRELGIDVVKKWFNEKDRIVGDKLHLYGANQLSGTSTYEVILDENGNKAYELVPESESDSEDED